MKLVENPEFSKRIKETLLRSNFIAEPDVQPAPIASKSEEPQDNDDADEGDEKPRPVADIQVLCFLGDKAQDDFRNRLGCYSYTEYQASTGNVLGLKNPPDVRWTPYIATSRNAELGRNSNNLIQGNFAEIADYIYHASGRLENAIGSALKGSKPISAINVDIPLGWTEEDNLPNEQELTSFCRRLGRSHPLALIISGPQNLVDQYVRKMQDGLTKLKARTFASITVKDGYLCTNKENVFEASEAFYRARKLRKSKAELAKKIARIQGNAEDYLETRVTYKKLYNQMGEERDQEESEKLRKTLQTASEKINRIHSAWRECQWSTKGAKDRAALIAQDDQLEENIKKWVEATLAGEAEPAALEESKTLLAKEIVEMFDKIKALQEDVLANGETCYYTPWGLKYFCIGANYYGPEEPLFLSLQNWGDDSKLPTIKTAQSSHLMVTSQTGHRSYPIGSREIIRNPADFPVLPPEFRKRGVIDGLKTPLTCEEIKIDTRLTARPSIRAELLLETDNLQTHSYNPVTGKPTGIRDASLWRPVITRRGIHHVENMLAPFGYKIDCPPEVHNFVERKVKKAERKLAPNYALTPYEALAYYENGPRTAAATIHHPDTGEILWKEGKSYHITPSWRRQTMMVDHSIEDEEQNEDKEKEKETAAAVAEQNDIVILNGENAAKKINNGARIRTLTERRINYGFATFIVEAEGSKTYEVKETVSHETIGMEKERIATEIEHVQKRIDELEPRLKDKENELSRSELDELRILRARREEKQVELDTWAPMLEDFIAAFPPEAPPLASEIYGEEIQNASKAIYTRFAPFFQGENGCTLKDYQLRWASLGSVKRSHLNGSTPGAGKSIMSIMASWRMGHHYNWVICPTIAMKTWAAELDRVGLYHEMVGYRKTEEGDWEERPNVYEHMRQLRDRFHRRERQTNRLGNIEPEYYIISAENVCLGGDGNKVYSPWAAMHPVLGAEKRKKLAKAIKEGEIKVPKHWSLSEGENRMVFYIWSDRADSSKEIEDAGFSDFLKPVRFIRVHPVCPKCEASKPVWTRHGFCNKCGHRQSAITQIPSRIKLSKGRRRLKCVMENIVPEKNQTPDKIDWTGGKKSLRQYPLYKMMGKHVGCKIIDEVHNWANFHSQHGAALQQVKSKDSIILSGTLCKTHIRELEPSLCQVYEPNSGEFPYSPWGMALFKEQFETIEIESVYRETQGVRTQVRRRNSEKVVPEASNLTKLRALMHGVMCSVGENEMERVWGIKPIHESIRYVELQPENAAIHQDWARMLREAAADCKTQQERIGLLRKARNQLTHLAYACDGPEKLNATVEWIREGMERGERSTIVGPSTKFYTMLCKRLKELKIPFMALGNTPPEKRYEVLNKFRDSKCPNFVSRIRLINVNFNQLTCCTRILFTGIDPSPSALRQMQKRLNRIGQTKDVHCTFLISQMPPDRPEPVSTHPLSVFNQPIDLEETESEEPELERAPSYEERLFALVLRRETAIKQTLQQADRQRDPQELYELLKDRQTLNQLLEDIIQDTKADPEIQQKIKEMADSGKTAVEKPKMPRIEKPERKKKPTPPEDDLPAPKGYQFIWTPPKKKFPNVLQGELFSL